MQSDVAKFVGVFFLVLVLCIAGTWLAQGSDFFLQRWLAPRQEAVRRNTFEQSKAYRQGLAQELQQMQFEYVSADDAHKDALGALILHRTADVDLNTLPDDLRTFVENLRRDRLNPHHGVTP